MAAGPCPRGNATLRDCLGAPLSLASGEMDPSLAQCLLARGGPSPKGSVYTFCKSLPHLPCCMHVVLYSQSVPLVTAKASPLVLQPLSCLLLLG